ncbi:hypothetical protein PFISCL1PPCAC_22358, partial [Pristionchus fissidentatus]
MPLRSKSVPPKKKHSPPPELHHDTHSDLGEEVEVLPVEHLEKRKKKVTGLKSSKKRMGSASRHFRVHSSIADRPEWNNDTHIDGYDDLDENGKVKRKGELHTLNGEKSKKQQEELNKMWSESLR